MAKLKMIIKMGTLGVFCTLMLVAFTGNVGAQPSQTSLHCLAPDVVWTQAWVMCECTDSSFKSTSYSWAGHAVENPNAAQLFPLLTSTAGRIQACVAAYPTGLKNAPSYLRECTFRFHCSSPEGVVYDFKFGPPTITPKAPLHMAPETPPYQQRTLRKLRP